jgi:predicted nucleotidyltransferase
MPMLTERYKVSQLGVFGSVAQNKATEESDIDIVVHMEPDMFKRFYLKEELEARLGREVDVIRYRDSMNPYLKARIDRDVLYV